MCDALPNASYIGFTGTPLELTDRSTRAVFGDYISAYDIQRAGEDGATAPIYYESRLAKLNLDEIGSATLDADFKEITEGEEAERISSPQSRWTQLEAIVGSERRLDLVAQDIVEHYEERLQAQKNVVQARSFEEMLEQSLSRHQNCAIEATEVIEELIELAREMREANSRGEALGLTEDEVAFYDALDADDSAVQVLGDDTLRKNGYPPDKQEQATSTVLEQAEVLSQEWAVA